MGISTPYVSRQQTLADALDLTSEYGYRCLTSKTRSKQRCQNPIAQGTVWKIKDRLDDLVEDDFAMLRKGLEGDALGPTLFAYVEDMVEGMLCNGQHCKEKRPEIFVHELDVMESRLLDFIAGLRSQEDDKDRPAGKTSSSTMPTEEARAAAARHIPIALGKKIDEQQEEIAELKREIADLKWELRIQGDENENRRRIIDEAEQTRDEAVALQRKAELQVRSLLKDLAAKDERLLQGRGREREQGEELEMLKSRGEELEARREELERERGDWERERKDWDDELRALNKSNLVLERENTDLKRERRESSSRSVDEWESAWKAYSAGWNRVEAGAAATASLSVRLPRMMFRASSGGEKGGYCYESACWHSNANRIPWPVKSLRADDVTDMAVEAFFNEAVPLSASGGQFLAELRRENARWDDKILGRCVPDWLLKENQKRVETVRNVLDAMIKYEMKTDV